MKKATKERIKTVRERVNDYRHARGLTIQALAEHWNLPYSTVRDWTQGDHGPRGAALALVEMKLAGN